MRDRKVRKLFVFFLIYLPIQYVIIGIVGYYQSEPWPVFVYPGFKTIHDKGSVIAINKPEFEITSPDLEESISIPVLVIFPEIPRSQILGFISTHFSELSQVDEFGEEAIEWLEELAKEYIDGDDFDLNIKWKTEYFSKEDIVHGPDSAKVNAVLPIIKRR